MCSVGIPLCSAMHHLATALARSILHQSGECALHVQAENDIQQALDLLSSPMCNAALQQALVASSVDPQGLSLPSELPPAVYQSHAAFANEVGVMTKQNRLPFGCTMHGTLTSGAALEPQS